jgi:hypothetical protein
LGLCLADSSRHNATHVDEWFDRAAELIVTERTRYQNLSDQSFQSRLSEIQRFLEQYQFELAQLDRDINEVVDIFEKTGTRAKEIEASAVGEVEKLRQSFVNQFTTKVAARTEQISKETTRHKEELLQFWNKVERRS